MGEPMTKVELPTSDCKCFASGDKVVIQLNNVNIEIEFKPIKNIHLSVYPPDGRVHISAPVGTSEEKIRLYALQKWVWITEKRRQSLSQSRQLPREYVSGEEHFLRGQSFRLKVITMHGGSSHVEVDGDYIKLYVQENSPAKRRAQILDDWYRSDLKRVLSILVEKWEKILNVQVSTWDVLRMTARWGSCSREKSKILFNLELAKKPCHCVEYIVAHELSHLIERTHNDRFRQILYSHLPMWMETRKELNEFPLSGDIIKEDD
ncbi:MAG: SprT family zinc-dependent metalloprotease [Planctomycetia bacterium]|nr:SprT family zinc-dependent metalloprotease [Planctomycetia bacterium]